MNGVRPIALSILQKIDGEGHVTVESAAVVERDPSGRLQVPEGTDNARGESLAEGSLIGMLIGVLGGSIGTLLGLGAGGLAGGAVDLDRTDAQDRVLAEFGREIPAGKNALLAEVD